VSEGALHRFAFQTDDEGFRNARTRERIDVAALGDSFTDAMTMDADASWPSQLEGRLGLTVQNYGTAGFGPQQELRILEDYVAAHRPRLVVLAFFAGNDLFDAEAFDEFERSNGHGGRVEAGWRLKDVFSRADTWFVVSALRAGAAWAARAQPSASAEAAELNPAPAESAPIVPGFDRGLFTATVAGRPIRWAFMPPYLNTLNFSETELRQRRGWSLTRDAILAMRRATASFGGSLVVMFLPFKSQVYWPMLERALPPDTVRTALHFYLDGNQREINLGAMRRNRLAQNRMMRELCERAHIPFLDTTGALQARLES
jgi:lysophospholipase L1-like esterase